MSENTFTSVQEGRHAVRDLLAKAHKSYSEQDGFVAERVAVDALTGEAQDRLRGVVGLSQEQQVERLTQVGALISAAITVATLPEAVEALTEAVAIVKEAGEANDSVKSLAADRDFEAWQEEKRAKREASYSESSSDEDWDDDEDDDEE